MRDTTTELDITGDVRRARLDHADKRWMTEEARRSDRETRSRQEGLVAAGIFVFGALFSLAAYDWTQDMAWARALVALIYQVGPV